MYILSNSYSNLVKGDSYHPKLFYGSALFILLILAVLSLLYFMTQAFSTCGKWGLLSRAVWELLTVVASLIGEQGL